MRPVSSQFNRVVRGSHLMSARARVVAPGQTGTDPDGTEIPIHAGDVLLDGAADVRATLDLTVPAEAAALFPTTTADLLAPYGNELFIERGVRFGNGVTEWVSQGYFRIDDVDQPDAPDGPIQIAAPDRMQGVIDSDPLVPIQFAAGTTVGAIVQGLVDGAYSWAPVVEWDDGDDATIARAMVCEERFPFIRDLVKSRGKVFYWDYRGVPVVEDPPDPGAAVYDINAGREGVLVQMSRTLSRKRIYNGVTAFGEATDTLPPALAYAVDLNPDSPTFFYGPFGFQTRKYSSPFITTDEQAFTAAAAILQQSLGAPYNVSFGAVPHPGLEPSDPITVTYPKRSRSIAMRIEQHVLDKLKIPLTPDQPMTAQTREFKPGAIGAPDL